MVALWFILFICVCCGLAWMCRPADNALQFIDWFEAEALHVQIGTLFQANAESGIHSFYECVFVCELSAQWLFEQANLIAPEKSNRTRQCICAEIACTIKSYEIEPEWGGLDGILPR